MHEVKEISSCRLGRSAVAVSEEWAGPVFLLSLRAMVIRHDSLIFKKLQAKHFLRNGG